MMKKAIVTSWRRHRSLRVVTGGEYASRWTRCGGSTVRCFGAPHENNKDDEEAPSSPPKRKGTEWIPPSRPLPGDKGRTHLHAVSEEEEELRRLQEELERLELQEKKRKQDDHLTTTTHEDEDTVVDWLETRRSAQTKTAHMKKPGEDVEDLQQADWMPAIKEHTLFSAKELVNWLDAVGGKDIVTIRDDREKRRMGFGMILVSASDRRLLRNVAENLVLLLRQRNLHQVGVVGAEAGVEGQSDHYQDSNWLVVDCGNYVVHLQDELTRKAVNLEGLWTGKDGLHRLNLLDDNAVEDYVANNPVPEDYHWASSGGSTDVDETIKQLQRSRWTIPHQPVVRKPKRKRGRRR